MKIVYSPKFLREYKKLSRTVKFSAEKAELLFRKDPFDLRLKTHKLNGRLQNYYSLSVGFRYRIIFEFVEKDLIYFHSVGDHDIYQ